MLFCQDFYNVRDFEENIRMILWRTISVSVKELKELKTYLNIVVYYTTENTN